MARMKGFYMMLGVMAIVGGGVLAFMAMSGGSPLPSGPIDPAAIDAARSFGGYTIGNADAPVEIVEYADFECPACRETWALTMIDVKERLVRDGSVRLTFRDFPLQIHAHARAAHHAAACANEQGAFWAMHDKLFLEQRDWASVSGSAEGKFRNYAEAIVGDIAAYDACMGEGRYRAQIQASFEGGVRLGVNATPSFVIGNRVYPPMSYDDMKAIVDSVAMEQGQ